MLTKDDLEQIGRVVDEKIAPLSQAVQKIAPLYQDVQGLKKGVKAIKSDTRYLRKSINLLIEYVEREDMKLKKRIEQIEERLETQHF